MFPELKHYLCDKKVNIKQTVIGHLEMFAQKFENYYDEALMPVMKMLDTSSIRRHGFASSTSPCYRRVYGHDNRSNKSYFFCVFKRTIPKRFCKYPPLGFHDSSVSNSFEICDKKIDSVCDNLALRNCI